MAGHLGLDHLVVIFDDNHITIDGTTALSCSDDIPERFRAYGWRVLELGEVSENLDALEKGLREAGSPSGQPTLVVLRSHIGFPSPARTDSPKAHGEPLGAEDVAATKRIMGLDPEKAFQVDEAVLAFYRAAGVRGGSARAAWESDHSAGFGNDAAEWNAVLHGGGLPGWEAKLPSFVTGESVATRASCATVLSALVDVVPSLFGGGADLTGNTGVQLKGTEAFSAANPSGRLMHFGIREHAMAASMVGMALHGGVIPFGGTFFVFSDYMRPSIRLAALTGAHVAFVCSHDSIGLGEDGPTHQPIEHLASLRAMPDLRVVRPADANEVVAAWQHHLNGSGPMVLVLSRQGVPTLDQTAALAESGIARGGYVLDSDEDPRVTLIGTGAELSLCVEAASILRADGVRVRVVSLPCWESFEALSADDREEVLGVGVPRVSIEAGSTFGWARYANDSVGIDTFGASAPSSDLFAHFKITAEELVLRARALIS